jgi:hypothetical protein
MNFCLSVTDASVLFFSGMETCGIVIVSGTAAGVMRETARILDRKILDREEAWLERIRRHNP